MRTLVTQECVVWGYPRGQIYLLLPRLPTSGTSHVPVFNYCPEKESEPTEEKDPEAGSKIILGADKKVTKYEAKRADYVCKQKPVGDSSHLLPLD
jgi:hypothetical protein